MTQDAQLPSGMSQNATFVDTQLDVELVIPSGQPDKDDIPDAHQEPSANRAVIKYAETHGLDVTTVTFDMAPRMHEFSNTC